MISVVTPTYNESGNLPLLYERLLKILDTIGKKWEWIIVDDHSEDETFDIASSIAHRDERVYVLRLSRNFGSHTAATCGFHQAKGECAILMAADLQDPPEIIPELLAQWQEGAQVVWAARDGREEQKNATTGFSRAYYFLMRRWVGFKNMPAAGADFFLLDRCVLDAFSQFQENNVSLMALITWMGFRQATITYHKQPRLQGHSGWTFEKKLKLVIDSVSSFSYLPIRWISYVGFFIGLIGLLLLVIRAWMIAALLILSGIQMLMLGVLGEYLWRALDESRRRPRYLIEKSTGRRTHETKPISSF